MSFILEAIKKSEQQRQQKNPSQQKVRKRTLSLPTHQSNRRLYWILTGLLSIALLCGWWLYSNREQTPPPPSLVNRPSITTPSNQTRQSKPATSAPKTTRSVVTNDPQSLVSVTEPAPMPRIIVSSPPPLAQPSTAVSTSNQSRGSVTEPHTIGVMPPKPMPVQLPLYLDLSRELRNRIPDLAMSMHYYTTNPDRRLVRINNQLLHEDDWVDQDLQVIEITPSGVTLDFSGKRFEMRSPSR